MECAVHFQPITQQIININYTCSSEAHHALHCIVYTCMQYFDRLTNTCTCIHMYMYTCMYTVFPCICRCLQHERVSGVWSRCGQQGHTSKDSRTLAALLIKPQGRRMYIIHCTCIQGTCMSSTCSIIHYWPATFGQKASNEFMEDVHIIVTIIYTILLHYALCCVWWAST